MPPKIPKSAFQPSPLKEEAKQALQDGMSVKDATVKFQLSERTLYEYKKELEDEKKGVTKNSTGGDRVVKEETEVPLAVVTTRQPGPIVFRMGQTEIDLNPNPLYDAWRYCEDIKRMEPSIDDDFSSMLKVAAKHIWEHFSEREAARITTSVELKQKEG